MKPAGSSWLPAARQMVVIEARSSGPPLVARRGWVRRCAAVEALAVCVCRCCDGPGRTLCVRAAAVRVGSAVGLRGPGAWIRAVRVRVRAAVRPRGYSASARA
jgi:hypothetical protein